MTLLSERGVSVEFDIEGDVSRRSPCGAELISSTQSFPPGLRTPTRGDSYGRALCGFIESRRSLRNLSRYEIEKWSGGSTSTLLNKTLTTLSRKFEQSHDQKNRF